ncbi:MAG: DUF374 domain-containing protein [Proteobacteria bacterium]|nr:DUF374 domain-containing protein [Pseudomonadota bacterium]
MVSRAAYMQPIAFWCRAMGLNLARGGSGLGGKQALMELAKALGAGCSVSIAVNGPAGPAFVVKRGCFELAKIADAPIIPVSYSCDRGASEDRRWDKSLRPKLFDRINVIYGSAIRVLTDEESATLDIICHSLTILNRDGDK